MANAITLFKKYIALLDEVYKEAAITSPLDSDGSLIRQGANANELIIPKMTMDALADYSRSGGYVSGDVSLTNETVSYNYDRGRSFTVDAMDNEETARALPLASWPASLSAPRWSRSWTPSALPPMPPPPASPRPRRQPCPQGRTWSALCGPPPTRWMRMKSLWTTGSCLSPPCCWDRCRTWI